MDELDKVFSECLQDYKDSDMDFYTLVASRLFHIPYNNITNEQIKWAKHRVLINYMHSSDPEILKVIRG